MMHILPFPAAELTTKKGLAGNAVHDQLTTTIAAKSGVSKNAGPIGKAGSMGTSQGLENGPGQISASPNHSIGRGQYGSRMLVAGHGVHLACPDGSENAGCRGQDELPCRRSAMRRGHQRGHAIHLARPVTATRPRQRQDEQLVPLRRPHPNAVVVEGGTAMRG